MSLGFVAINNLQPDNADFVIEQPTPHPTAPAIEVLHYASPYTLPATNRLFTFAPPE